MAAGLLLAVLVLCLLQGGSAALGPGVTVIYSDNWGNGWNGYPSSGNIQECNQTNPYMGTCNLYLEYQGSFTIQKPYQFNFSDTTTANYLEFYIRSDMYIYLNVSFQLVNGTSLPPVYLNQDGFLGGTDIDDYWRLVRISLSVLRDNATITEYNQIARIIFTNALPNTTNEYLRYSLDEITLQLNASSSTPVGVSTGAFVVGGGTIGNNGGGLVSSGTNTNGDTPKHGPNAGAIAAGVLVPVFVIGVIVGIIIVMKVKNGRVDKRDFKSTFSTSSGSSSGKDMQKVRSYDDENKYEPPAPAQPLPAPPPSASASIVVAEKHPSSSSSPAVTLRAAGSAGPLPPIPVPLPVRDETQASSSPKPLPKHKNSAPQDGPSPSPPASSSYALVKQNSLKNPARAATPPALPAYPVRSASAGTGSDAFSAPPPARSPPAPSPAELEERKASKGKATAAAALLPPRIPQINPNMKRIFGVSIYQAVQGAEAVPAIVLDTVQYLTDHGLDEEGIMRLAGSTSEVLKYRTAYDNGERVDFSQCSDINSVGDLLKKYLRELPEILIPHPVISLLQEAAANEVQEEKLFLLRQAITCPAIGVPQRLTLKVLFIFLQQVIQHSSRNRMTSSNIALVFSPTLQIPPDVLDALIKNAEAVFTDV